MSLFELKRSPFVSVLILGGAFVALVAIFFFSRSDDPPRQITMEEQEAVEPSADNVDPTFHARLMALRQEVGEAPRDTSKLLELARLYQDGHQMVEAAETYEQLLIAAPEHKQARLDLALCYSQLGRWEEAQATMEELLEQYPEDPSALYNLGAIHANQGRYDEAERLWERVQAQSGDVHLAAQASASLVQLETLRLTPVGQSGGIQQSEPPAVLPGDHPTIPLNDYEPVIAGQ